MSIIMYLIIKEPIENIVLTSKISDIGSPCKCFRNFRIFFTMITIVYLYNISVFIYIFSFVPVL